MRSGALGLRAGADSPAGSTCASNACASDGSPSVSAPPSVADDTRKVRRETVMVVIREALQRRGTCGVAATLFKAPTVGHWNDVRSASSRLRPPLPGRWPGVCSSDTHLLMPELPDVIVYCEALVAHVCGRRMLDVVVA